MPVVSGFALHAFLHMRSSAWDVYGWVDLVRRVVITESGDSSVAICYCLGVLALEDVKLIFLMPSAPWTFRLLFELAFLTPAVQPAIDELHYSNVVSFGEAFACVSNPSPEDVIVVFNCLGVARLVLLEEPLDVLYSQRCLLDSLVIVGCHPFIIDN